MELSNIFDILGNSYFGPCNTLGIGLIEILDLVISWGIPICYLVRCWETTILYLVRCWGILTLDLARF